MLLHGPSLKTIYARGAQTAAHLLLKAVANSQSSSGRVLGQMPGGGGGGGGGGRGGAGGGGGGRAASEECQALHFAVVPV